MLDRKELKIKAREAMRETRPHAVWVTLMVTVILLAVEMLSLNISGNLEAYRTMFESAMNGQIVYAQASGSDGFIPWILTLALDVMTMVVSVGYVLYTMRLFRRQSPGFGDVFDAFGVFFRAVWLRILKSLVMMLWVLAFSIPLTLLTAVILAVSGDAASVSADVLTMAAEGVSVGSGLTLGLTLLFVLAEMAAFLLAFYRYRLADYLMLDHPEYSVMQCLSLSRMAMKGHNWELFKLDLSFLGWWVLSLIPFVGLWVRPYAAAAVAGWYDGRLPAFWEEVKNRPIPQPVRYQTPGTSGWHIPGGSEDEKDGVDGEDDDPDDHWE